MNDIQNTIGKESKSFIKFEDFEIEDIPFKAINEGLGFHHSTKNTSNELHIHKKVYEKAIQKNEDIAQSVPSELTAFYNTAGSTPKVNREISITEIREREASLVKRFAAFLIDILVTTLFCSVLLSLMFISTNMTITQFATEITLFPISLFPMTLFILLHNICAISFGFSQTIGQRLLSIKNKFTDENTVLDICKRTQFELISIMILGIPYLLKLDQKLFSNKVVTK